MNPVRTKQASTKTASIPAELRSQIGGVPKQVDSFVGKVEGTNAYIGVVDRDGVVEAFVCDGKDASWLTGSARRNQFTAQSPNGAILAALRDGSALAGNITFAGASRKFSAAAAVFPADIWEADELNAGKVVHATWIMLADGTQRGAGLMRKAVVPIAPLEASGTPQDLSIGGTGAMPVPMQKTVGTKWSQTCAGLEQTWDILMDVFHNPNTSADDRKDAGNRAAAIYRKAMWKGCSWAPSPSAPTT